jgi:hypothetical protein
MTWKVHIVHFCFIHAVAITAILSGRTDGDGESNSRGHAVPQKDVSCNLLKCPTILDFGCFGFTLGRENERSHVVVGAIWRT